MSKLNLGCGTDYREDWVNVDMGDCRCDVKHDLRVLPWPFEDSSVSHILMQHILEHFPHTQFVEIVRELYRVCSNGAVIEIVSPHATSDNYWTDPTHDLPLTTRKFDYFDPEKPLGQNGKIYGWNDVHLNVVRANIIPNFPNGPDVGFHLSVIKPSNW